jgi:5'-nucleotidase
MPSKTSRKNILVVNDDGINGRGLMPLVRAMRRLGSVTVVVPEMERSADSHSLTLHKPIRVRNVAKGVHTTNGSPADCVRLAVLEVMRGKIDLVVSGINNGLNLGEDVVYSGTVAGAMEAVLLELPAIAFSQARGGKDFSAAAAFSAGVARQVLRRGLPTGLCLNVNFPEKSPYKAPVFVRLGNRIYSTDVTKRADPRGDHYYWLAGKNVSGVNTQGTDVAALALGHVTVTPLRIDNTDYAMLETLKTWSF